MINTAILCAINTFVAWRFALLFIKRKPAEVWFDSLLGAAVHGLLFLVLYRVAHEEYMLGIELLWFLLMTIIVQLQSRDGYGNAVIAFGLAQTVYAMLDFIGNGACGIWKYPGILYYLVCIICFLAIMHLIRDRFPTENWREYYSNGYSEPERIDIKIWHIYLIIVLGSGVMTAFMWLINGLSQISFIIVSVGLLALFGCEIGLLVLMHTYKRERIEILLEQQYRSEMQSFMNVIRSQRHDYNFHVQTIAGLLREGNLEECLKYMDALEKDSAIMNSVLPVKDPAISAMIHNFHILAVREGISLHIDIQNDLTQIATNAYETNKIISNLLQNAIDETKTHADKSYGIWLTVLKRGEYIVIRVSNEVDPLRIDMDNMNQIYRQGYTTKQGHEGVGLSSIKQLAGRYHGTVYTQLDRNVIHFVAKIPINFAKGQENADCGMHGN